MNLPNRRSFLKSSGIALLPAFIPATSLSAANSWKQSPNASKRIDFFGDGEVFEPESYLNELAEANKKSPIQRDRYGNGGAILALEKKFVELTGKEKAIFMPTGTMANQLAIAVLSGDNPKVFVQDTSHVYRDEADAAQSIFNKRLMPLAKNETYFTADQLKVAIDGLSGEEAFRSGIGCVSIENPVRRTKGTMVPMEEIKKISTYCRTNHIKLHLDGARIFMASAWSGISVKEYASYFDTIYISLYKYFGASAGAILCGDKAVMDKMPHLVKVHGGNMYGNWLNAAMALHRVDGFEDRLKQAIARSKEVFDGLNKIEGVNVSPMPGGTNINNFRLSKEINGYKMAERLFSKYNIRLPAPDQLGDAYLYVNETILNQEAKFIIDAMKESINATR